MRRLVLLLASALLFAGCAGFGEKATPSPTPAPGAVLDPMPFDPIDFDHKHSDHSLHNLSVNLDFVAHHGGYATGENRLIPAGQGFSELFVRHPYAYLGRRGGNDGGFVILDITEPKLPQRVGEFQGLANYDMESTYDNRYVFFVSQYLNTQQMPSVPPRGMGDVPRGIHVVDISNPKNPVEVPAGYFPVPTRGVHTITYFREGDNELLAAQTYDFLPDPSLGTGLPGQGANPVAQRVILFKFVRTPAVHLEIAGVFEKHNLQPVLGAFFPHDVAIQKHPTTNKILMYVGYWDLGAFIVDITNPAQPLEISNLNDFSPSKIKSVHLAAPSDYFIASRHITVTEPELGGGESETGQFTVFDTTDPAKPKRLGFWTLPGELGNDEGTRFSPHNFEIKNGYMVLAHYHAGIWLIDLHNVTRLEAPKAVAFAQPNLEREAGFAGDIPNVWSALFHDGQIYASDIAGGLYVYDYRGATTGDCEYNPDQPACGAPNPVTSD